MKVDEFEKKINYKFKNKALINLALIAGLDFSGLKLPFIIFLFSAICFVLNQICQYVFLNVYKIGYVEY